MGKLLVVIKREYLERVRSRWFVLSTFLGPLLLAGIMAGPAILTARNLRDTQVTDFQVLDATKAGLGARLARILRSRALNAPERKALGAAASPLAETRITELSPAELAAAETTATHAVMAGTSRGYLVLDSATMADGNARYAGKNASSIAETQQIENALRSALLTTALETAGISGPRADSLSRARANLSTERITASGRGGSGTASAIFGIVIAILLYMMILLYGQNILRAVLEEKTTRVAEVVVSSVKPDILLAGKVLGSAAVGLTQQLVWLTFAGVASAYGIATAAAVGNLQLPHVPAWQIALFISYFLLGYTFYASLFAAVGAMCNDPQEAGQAALPVMLPFIFAMAMLQPVLTSPTGTIATVMSVLPFSAPIIMPIVMSGTTVPAWQITLSIVGLLIACAGAVWVSARIYRVGLLMTGKRPSMKELVRWVKYA